MDAGARARIQRRPPTCAQSGRDKRFASFYKIYQKFFAKIIMATPYESGELEELGTTQSVSAQKIPTHPK